MSRATAPQGDFRSVAQSGWSQATPSYVLRWGQDWKGLGQQDAMNLQTAELSPHVQCGFSLASLFPFILNSLRSIRQEQENVKQFPARLDCHFPHTHSQGRYVVSAEKAELFSSRHGP